MTIHETRLANTQSILKYNFKGNKGLFAKAIGKHPNYISRWWTKNDSQKRNIGDTTARLIENSVGLSKGWLDIPHESYELEPNHNTKTQQQVAARHGHPIPLSRHCTIDTSLSLTELSLKSKGVLMLISTDRDAYGLQFVGHHSNPILSDGWGIVVEPNTPLTVNEYALIQLNNGELLLRIISYQDDESIITTNPLDKQQHTLRISDISSAHYCYIAVPPSKIIKTDN